MYPRFNKIYYLFILSFSLSFVVLIVLLILWNEAVSGFKTKQFEDAIISLSAFSLINFFGLFVFFLWERWTRYREPRSQIKFKFLNSILNANQSCLITRNRLNKIIWSNNWDFLQKALNTKTVYYFNLKRLDKNIEKFRIGQSINFVQDSDNQTKNEYQLMLIEKDLLLLHAKTEEFTVSQMFLQTKPVFLVITLDKISSNLQEGDFERLETQILMQIRIELYEELKQYDILIFNSNPYEWMLIMKTKQLAFFRAKNFDFLTKIENKIKEKYKILITFSVGCYLGFQTVFKDRTNLEFHRASLIELYQKTLLARRMAQVRGGDQVILTDASSAFTVYGKQRDLPKVDTSNIKNFLTKFIPFVKKYETIIIVGHKQADFDVVGAGVALNYFLKKRLGTKKAIHFIINKIADKTLSFVKDKISSEVFQKYISLNAAKIFTRANPKKTLLIVVDTNNPDFIDFPNQKIPNMDKIFIDHHVNCFKGDPIMQLISSTFSSTSEIILSLMIQANISRTKPYRFNHDPDVLRLLLFGILIDTNNLQVQIGKYTLEVVNFIIQNGINMEEMINEINHFKTASSRAIDLYSNEFQTKHIDKNKIILEFNNDFLVNAEIVANLAEKYLANNKVSMVFAIGHDQNGVIYLSGRSQAPYNVEVICKHFGGGGDSRRAAAKINDIDMKLGLAAQKLTQLVADQK